MGESRLHQSVCHGRGERRQTEASDLLVRGNWRGALLTVMTPWLPATRLERPISQTAIDGGLRWVRNEPTQPNPSEEILMVRVEYKVEMVHWKDEPETRLAQLADHLNEFAKDGWRVVAVDLMAHASFGIKALPVLLEREVQ